jgi:hypothetical protein
MGLVDGRIKANSIDSADIYNMRIYISVVFKNGENKFIEQADIIDLNIRESRTEMRRKRGENEAGLGIYCEYRPILRRLARWLTAALDFLGGPS